VFEGAPLNTPAGLAINPLNGDLLVVNQLDNNLVEIGKPMQGNDDHAVAVRTLDPTKVNQKTGAGSALFGIAATTDAADKLKVYFTDDNTNTLDALTASMP
jgi:DNA-binding beta-propeller fold protein YncE